MKQGTFIDRWQKLQLPYERSQGHNRILATDATIAERPVPPKGRLSFPMLMLRMVSNPVASWGQDSYDEPMVVYRWLGLKTAFVMDPALIQTGPARRGRQLHQTSPLPSCARRRRRQRTANRRR